MSILSSLYHGEVHNKPNDVHNTPEKSTGHTDGSAVLPAHAQQRMQALRESPHTVASKLESKEEFPQG